MRAMRIEVAAPNAPDLIALMRAAPEIAIEELVRTTFEASFLLEREVKERTPAGIGAGGGLRGSIGAREPQVLADNVIGEMGTSLSYAIPVELGTRPHRPPIAPLQDWAEHKLGIDSERSRAVAFAIAGKIAKVGTKGAFMFRDALAAHRDQVDRMYRACAERILQRIEAGA